MKKQLIALVFCAVWLAPNADAAIESLYLGANDAGKLVQAERLSPGYEFLYPVMANISGIGAVPLTAKDLEEGVLQVRILSGAGYLDSVSLCERSGQAYLSLVPRPTGGIQEHEASIRLRYHSSSGTAVAEIPLRLGYQTASTDPSLSLAPGEAYPVSASSPLLTAELFDALSAANGFAESTLAGSGWQFTGQMTGMETQNLAVSHAPIDRVVQNNPNARMEFTAFPGLPDFEMKGTLTLDVGALADCGENLFLYRYAFGSLFPLSFDYQSDSNAVVFHPSQLSTYILSDTPLKVK